MEQPPRQPAETVNPEAGSHDITADPAALAACERAIAQTYAEFPYYSVRYGDRGRRFSSSDSGWLCLTADGPDDRTTHQILWLGRVLAARGMPRVLLEHHLVLLAGELTALDDERATARAARLSGVAALLRTRRLSAIPAAEVRAIETEFDAAAPTEWVARLPHTGLLIASAVADEADGVDNVVSSLMEWLGSTERFATAHDPEALDWLRAVHAALRRAEGAVRPLPREGRDDPPHESLS